jgi:hypothetical protein
VVPGPAVSANLPSLQGPERTLNATKLSAEVRNVVLIAVCIWSRRRLRSASGPRSGCPDLAFRVSTGEAIQGFVDSRIGEGCELGRSGHLNGTFMFVFG